MQSGWPEPMEEGRTVVMGFPLYYRICGEKTDRPTVLCLHGGPGGTHDYLQPLADLTRGGYRVVFIDQLGCGRSERITDRSLITVDHHVEEVEEARANLDLGAVHLFGSSYGGLLAIAYTLAYPKNVRTLVTAGGIASIPLANRELDRWFDQMPPPHGDVIRAGNAARQYDSPEYQAALDVFYRTYLCRLPEWPEPLRYTLDQMSRPVYEYMNGPNEFTIVGTIRDWDVSDRLGTIRVPTLVTGGRYDEVSPAVARQIADGIPGAELAVFEKSSHVPFWEERDAYIDRVRRFLDRHSTPP